MRWLEDNYLLSYMEIVETSVYRDIRKAFDAMVIELKWCYDKKRSFLAKFYCGDRVIFCIS